MTSSSVRTQIIGAAGEALVTYKLLKHEIDSARMTTDAGVDLVMYVPGTRDAATIQVKAQWAPVPAGGKGGPAFGWVFNPECPADWLAVVDLSHDNAWLFTIDEARDLVRQSVDNLPEFLRQVVNLAYFQGLPYRDVAEVLGIPVGTVKSRLHTALQRLQDAWTACPSLREV